MNSNACVFPSNSLSNQSESEDVPLSLRIRSVKHLSITLGISEDRLMHLAQNSSNYYREFTRDIKGKHRLLVEATGRLKLIQRRILDNILIRIPPFESSFGSIKGRSIKENAFKHVKSKYILKLDIQDFYPSIHNKKIYNYFIEKDCSPDVSHILTHLTTRNYSLPLGTSTSPMLADQVVRKIDVRINGMAKKAGLVYTRYVDDITLSGNFLLDRMREIVFKILKQSGFKIKKNKLIYYTPENEEERIVAGVSIQEGMVSAPLNYVKELEEQLKNAIYQSRREYPQGDIFTGEHYRGKIGYVRWLNPKLGEKLFKLHRKVKWKHLEWVLRNQ